jgi:hypothetical protein
MRAVPQAVEQAVIDQTASPIPNPSRARGSEEEQLAIYRTVRDAIGERIKSDLLGNPGVQPG